jgi:hypothetical protein
MKEGFILVPPRCHLYVRNQPVNNSESCHKGSRHAVNSSLFFSYSKAFHIPFVIHAKILAIATDANEKLSQSLAPKINLSIVM